MHYSAPAQDRRVLTCLNRLETPVLLLTTTIAVAILLVWSLPLLAAIAPAGWEGMKKPTAVGILLATASVALSHPSGARLAHRVSALAAWATLALGLAGLATYVSDIQLAPAMRAQRPSPQTAIGFVLAGLSLSLIRKTAGPLSLAACLSTFAFGGLVLFLLGGYLFQIAEFVGVDASNRTSPQTLLCLGLLACVIGSRRAVSGNILTFFANNGIGSKIGRMVVPGIVVTPFAMFLAINALERSGVMSMAHSRAAAVPIIVLLTLGVVIWIGRHANGLEEQLRLQSLTDAHTNVLNQRGFNVASEYIIRDVERTRRSLSVFYFDLDGLKAANDRLGHHVGSWMIRQFAEALTSTFRSSDIIARVGGDEFVVLAVDAFPSEAAILQRLARNVSERNARPHNPCGIAYSVGYARQEGDGTREIAELVTLADQRMYEHKSRNKAA